MLRREAFEVDPREPGEPRRLQRDDGGRPRLAGEQRHLADDPAGADLVQQRRRPVGAVDANRQPARHDQAEVVARIALPQDHIPGGRFDRAQRREQLGKVGGGQRTDEQVPCEQRLDAG